MKSAEQIRTIYNKAYDIQRGLPIMGTRVDPEYNSQTKFWLAQRINESVVRGAKILELGGGDGDFGPFTRKEDRWFATDISHTGLSAANQRSFKNLHPAVVDGSKIPVASGSVHAVVAADSMEHMPDPAVTIREVRRVLMPGGIFVLTVPTKNSLRNWILNQLSDGLSPSLIQTFLKTGISVAARIVFFGTPNIQPIDHDLSTKQWMDLLVQNGFNIQKAEVWPPDPKKPMVSLVSAQKA